MRNFAYGSNMCKGRLAERVADAEFVGLAHLTAFDLRFHKRSVDGSGKCDAYFTGDPDDIIWGAIVDIPDSRRGELDAAEGLGRGYEERHVTVIDRKQQPHNVMMYVATISHIDPALAPYCWYLSLVLEGAQSQGLPDTYLARISATPCKSDTGQSPGRPTQKVDC